MNSIQEVLNRVATVGDKELMSFLISHSPIIKHGGDQREPTEEISCTCKKVEFVISSLDVPYFIHLYDEMRKAGY